MWRFRRTWFADALHSAAALRSAGAPPLQIRIRINPAFSQTRFLSERQQGSVRSARPERTTTASAQHEQRVAGQPITPTPAADSEWSVDALEYHGNDYQATLQNIVRFREAAMPALARLGRRPGESGPKANDKAQLAQDLKTYLRGRTHVNVFTLLDCVRKLVWLGYPKPLLAQMIIPTLAKHLACFDVPTPLRIMKYELAVLLWRYGVVDKKVTSQGLFTSMIRCHAFVHGLPFRYLDVKDLSPTPALSAPGRNRATKEAWRFDATHADNVADTMHRFADVLQVAKSSLGASSRAFSAVVGVAIRSYCRIGRLVEAAQLVSQHGEEDPLSYHAVLISFLEGLYDNMVNESKRRYALALKHVLVPLEAGSPGPGTQTESEPSSAGLAAMEPLDHRLAAAFFNFMRHPSTAVKHSGPTVVKPSDAIKDDDVDDDESDTGVYELTIGIESFIMTRTFQPHGVPATLSQAEEAIKIMFSFPPRSDTLETPTSDEYGTLSRPTGPESQVDRLDTVLEALVLPTDDTEATQRSTAMFKLCRHVCRLLAAAQGLTASAIAMLFLGHAMTARPSFTSQALRHLPLLGLDPSPLFYTALLEAWSGRFRPRLADGTEEWQRDANEALDCALKIRADMVLHALMVADATPAAAAVAADDTQAALPASEDRSVWQTVDRTAATQADIRSGPLTHSTGLQESVDQRAMQALIRLSCAKPQMTLDLLYRMAVSSGHDELMPPNVSYKPSHTCVKDVLSNTVCTPLGRTVFPDVLRLLNPEFVSVPRRFGLKPWLRQICNGLFEDALNNFMPSIVLCIFEYMVRNSIVTPDHCTGAVLAAAFADTISLTGSRGTAERDAPAGDNQAATLRRVWALCDTMAKHMAFDHQFYTVCMQAACIARDHQLVTLAGSVSPDQRTNDLNSALRDYLSSRGQLEQGERFRLAPVQSLADLVTSVCFKRYDEAWELFMNFRHFGQGRWLLGVGMASDRDAKRIRLTEEYIKTCTTRTVRYTVIAYLAGIRVAICQLVSPDEARACFAESFAFIWRLSLKELERIATVVAVLLVHTEHSDFAIKLARVIVERGFESARMSPYRAMLLQRDFVAQLTRSCEELDRAEFLQAMRESPLSEDPTLRHVMASWSVDAPAS